MNDKPAKVSDWSQPYKLILFVVFFVVAVWFGYSLLKEVRGLKELRVGVSANEINYKNVTNSSVTCGTATAAEIVATTTGRTSFTIGPIVSGTTAFLCKTASSSCTVTTGIAIFASNTTPFVQTDGYIGPYSCLGAGAASASSVIPYTHSQ